MKRLLFFIIVIGISSKSFGQIESNTKFKAIPPKNTNFKPKKVTAPPPEKPFIVAPSVFTNINILNTKPKPNNSFQIGATSTFSMVPKNNFDHSLGEVYQSQMTKDLSKTLVKEGLKEDDRLLIKIDVNFGAIKTKSKYFVIKYRDFMLVDHDMIKATLNKNQVGGVMELFGDFGQFVINLQDGINTFELEAVSKGTSGGNTCEFHIFDDQGKEVRSDFWDNWDVGVKGTFVIDKEKE